MAAVYDRTEMLIGAPALSNLKQKKIIIFGIGGVGGFAIEALARLGIENLTIVDFDIIDITNINRQIIALHSTVGMKKTEVMCHRISDINPAIKTNGINHKLTAENIYEFQLEKYDYILDAIDDVDAKVTLITYAKSKNINIISSMGTGNKMDPTQFKVTDIKKTHTCPLAKAMRRRLKDMGIVNVKVLFSSEIPSREGHPEGIRSRSPSSISFVPATAGLLLAYEVVKDLLNSD